MSVITVAVALAVRVQSPHIRRARCSKRATREHRRKNERNCAYLEQVPIHVPVLKRAVIDGGMNHVMRKRVTHEGSHKRNHYDKYDAQRAKSPARPVHVIARPIVQPRDNLS